MHTLLDKEEILDRVHLPCEKCNSLDFNRFVVRFKNNTNHHELRCSKCNAYVCYLPQPVDPNSASTYIISFGKYKDQGLTLKALKEKDPSYFKWLKENCNQKRIVKMIEILKL